MSERILSADVFLEPYPSEKWTARIAEHNPDKRTETAMAWERQGISTGHNAESAMEAAWQREIKKPSLFPPPPDTGAA